MRRVTLDASVVVKWFKTEGEEDAEKARKYLELLKEKNIEVTVPTLLFEEVLNVLAMNKDIRREFLDDVLDILFGLDMKVVSPDQMLLHSAVELARSGGMTMYDAVYLAVARRTNSRVVTCDKKLVERGKSLAVLLKDE